MSDRDERFMVQPGDFHQIDCLRGQYMSEKKEGMGIMERLQTAPECSCDI